MSEINTVKITSSLSFPEAIKLMKKGEKPSLIMPVGEKGKQSVWVGLIYDPSLGKPDSKNSYNFYLIDPLDSGLKDFLVDKPSSHQVFLPINHLLASSQQHKNNSFALARLRGNVNTLDVVEMTSKDCVKDNPYGTTIYGETHYIRREKDFTEKVIVDVELSKQVFDDYCAHRLLGDGIRVFTYLVPSD